VIKILQSFTLILRQLKTAMKKISVLLLLTVNFLYAFSQNKNKLFKGMYLQWGYNTEWYTKSTIHFRDVVNGVKHDFTIYKALAHDRNDLDAITKNPVEISIPHWILSE
jgi:hypothetical protein